MTLYAPTRPVGQALPPGTNLSPMTLTAHTSTETPLTISGTGGQSGYLFQIYDGSGNLRDFTASDGTMYLYNTIINGNGTVTGNLTVSGSSNAAYFVAQPASGGAFLYLNAPSGGNAGVAYTMNGIAEWQAYVNPGDTNWYFRDLVTPRMTLTLGQNGVSVFDRQLQVVNTAGPNEADNAIIIGGSLNYNADGYLMICRSVGVPGNEYLKITACEGGTSGLNNVYTCDRVINVVSARDMIFRYSENSGSSYITQFVLQGSANGGGVQLGVASPALTATIGFPYMPAAAGTPTGVPVAQTGCVPFRYDTTAHKLWIYDAGWKGVVVA